MLPNISWGETMILLIAALVILGPERLPGAIQWAFTTLRRVREYATGATAQLREEIGPEFDDLRKPIAELQRMRGMSPRTVITKHLLDGDDSFLRDVENTLQGDGRSAGTTATGYGAYSGTETSSHSVSGSGGPERNPLNAGERPPIDTDAT